MAVSPSDLERFSELVAASPTRLDEVALLIASHVAGPLDLAAELDRLDQLAGAVATPTMDALVAQLFGPGGFTGNSVDYYHPDNSYLNRVLDRRLGIPVTLCLLAHEVGHRVGVVTTMVGMPGHFLLGDATSPDRYVDPFNGARLLNTSEVEQLFRSLGGSGWDAAYLAPTEPLHVIRRILANLHRIATDRRDFVAEYRLLQLVTVIPGTTAHGHDRLDQLQSRFN